MSLAYQRIHEKYLENAGEHKGVKVLSVFTHGPGHIYNTKRPIKSIADLQGLKVRVGGGVVWGIAAAPIHRVGADGPRYGQALLYVRAIRSLYGSYRNLPSLALANRQGEPSG